MADNIKQLDLVAVQAATTVSDTETVMDSEIDVKDFDRMVVWMKYTKGTEDGVLVVPKFLIATSGDEYPFMDFSTDADALRTARRLKLTATINAYAILDISGVAIVKLYQLKSGGTASGTLKVDYSLLRQGLR